MHFHFVDLKDFSHWWLKIDHDEVDLCLQAPGLDEQLVIETTLRTLTEIWMGDVTLTGSVRMGKLKTYGLLSYERTLSKWLGQHRLADIRPPFSR